MADVIRRDSSTESMTREDIPLNRLDTRREPLDPPVDYIGPGEHVGIDIDGGQDLRGPSQGSILERLPSRRLHMADTASSLVLANRTLKRAKSHKRRKSLAGTMRIRDPELLLTDEDFVDAPSEIQAQNIRSCNTQLHKKKQFLDKLHKEGRRPKSINCCTRAAWRLAIAWKHFKEECAELRYSAELWNSHFKLIEGTFGSGVTSYFTILKGLFYLNILVFLVTFSFITIPMIVFRFRQQEPPGYTQNATFTGRELLTGGDWFADTELYYGYHYHGVIRVVPGMEYDMRYAYICACGGYYLLTVLLLAIFLSRSYRRHYIQESGATHSVCVTRVLCGWDYKIDQEETAKVKHKMLYKELQEYLAGFSASDEGRSCGQMTGIVLIRISTNVLILAMLGGAGYLVWYISINQSLSNTYDVLSEMAMPLCISGINFIIPFAFSILGHFEKYKNPRAEVLLTMIRTLTLHMVTLGVLLYFWFNAVGCKDGEEEQDDGPATENLWMPGEFRTCRKCWENFMGEQIYRLVIVDFVFVLIVTFFSEFIRRLMSNCCKSLGKPNFNIGRNTMNLMYSQMLIWLGTFYSPLLTVINIIKLFIIFYVKRVSVIQNCAPSTKPWRAGQTSTFILLLLFGAFIASFIAVAYSIIFLYPSDSCGPYQEFNSTYRILEDLLDTWQASESGHVVKSIIEIITSVGFLAFVLIGMGVAAYYTHVVSLAHKEMVKRIKYQITLEGKDKKFLLQLYQQAIGMTGSGGSSHQRETPSTTGDRSMPRQSNLRRRQTPKQTPAPGPTPAKGTPATQGTPASQGTPATQGTPLVETYNQSYLDLSMEATGNTLPSFNPQYRERSPNTQSLGAQNPAYRAQPPHQRADIPRNTLPYDNIRGK